MSTLNKCFLIGNLTRDPELKFSQSGTAICRFSIAVNQTIKDRKTVEFFTIVAFGKTGEICQKYITKGRPVMVEGHLHNNSFETKDGQKRVSLEVIADNVQFLGSGQQQTRQQDEPDAPDEPDPNVPGFTSEDVPF
jgi:single-strand DNA-binding protein